MYAIVKTPAACTVRPQRAAPTASRAAVPLARAEQRRVWMRAGEEQKSSEGYKPTGETPEQLREKEEDDKEHPQAGPGSQATVRADESGASTAGRIVRGGETHIRPTDPVPDREPGTQVGAPQSGVERN